MQHKWRARWVELTTESLRYFCSEFDSVRIDALPRGEIQIINLTDCTLGNKQMIKNPMTKVIQHLQTFIIKGLTENGNAIEFMLAAEDSSAIRWVSRIHRVMTQKRTSTFNTVTPPQSNPNSLINSGRNKYQAKSMIVNQTNDSGTLASSEESLHMAREKRDGCQDELLSLLQQREKIASRLRDLKGIESALLGPLSLQGKYKLGSSSTSSPPSTSPNRQKLHRVKAKNKGVSGRHKRLSNVETKIDNTGSAGSTGSTGSNGRATFRFATDVLKPEIKMSYDCGRNNINTHMSHYNSSSSSTSSKYVSNQAVWEESTSFFLGQEPTQNPSDVKSIMVKKLNEAIR